LPLGRPAPHNAPTITVSSERWLLSTLIAIHLVAITAASLPEPRELNLVNASATPGPRGDALARTVKPVLDAVVAAVAPLEAEAFTVTKPIRALTRTYIQAGLRQKWNMFANPVTADQYVRVAHYVGSSRDPGRVRVFQELVLPGQHENRPRLVHRFQDKAILNALEALAVDRLDHPGEQHYADLDPIASYFGNRFKAVYLAADETMLRTDVWFGGAAMPPVAGRLTDDQLQERWTVLQRYWDGPVDTPVNVTPLQPGALEGEGDIGWRLDYMQNR
jgi:hypothetical protein